MTLDEVRGQREYAIAADRLWDGVAAKPLAGLAVVVTDERIQAVTTTTELSADMPVVSFPGCTALPGLMDAHVHYSAVMGPAFLAAGVTTIRDVGNDLDWILERRAAHEDDPNLGPTIRCCGHLLDGNPRHWPHMGRGHNEPEALRASIREHVERGVDAIKLYAALEPEMFAVGVEEAHRLGMFVLAHLGETQAEDAIAAGIDGIEHFDKCEVAWRDATEAEDDALIDQMLAHEVVVDPTLVVWDRLGRILDRSLHHDDRRQWVHPCHRDIWQRYGIRFKEPAVRLRFQAGGATLKRFLLRCHQRGVKVALGTDTPFPHLVPGFSVHDELAMYVDAGISPRDALHAATAVNSEVLGVDSLAGTIAKGKHANVVIVRGDPLECIDDISNVIAVAHRGHLSDTAEQLKRIQQQPTSAPNDAITRALLDYVNGLR